MFGVPELMIVLVIGVFYAIPLIAAIWAVVTLKRIREGQDAVHAKLESVERLLQRS